MPITLLDLVGPLVCALSLLTNFVEPPVGATEDIFRNETTLCYTCVYSKYNLREVSLFGSLSSILSSLSSALARVARRCGDGVSIK